MTWGVLKNSHLGSIALQAENPALRLSWGLRTRGELGLWGASPQSRILEHLLGLLGLLGLVPSSARGPCCLFHFFCLAPQQDLEEENLSTRNG